MKTIRIKDLEGVALDWAVAKAINADIILTYTGRLTVKHSFDKWEPSTNWSQGGPLVEKYCMMVDVEVWVDKETEAKAVLPDGSHWTCFGPTPLIAICRAVVGVHTKTETVQIPDEMA